MSVRTFTPFKSCAFSSHRTSTLAGGCLEDSGRLTKQQEARSSALKNDWYQSIVSAAATSLEKCAKEEQRQQRQQQRRQQDRQQREGAGGLSAETADMSESTHTQGTGHATLHDAVRERASPRSSGAAAGGAAVLAGKPAELVIAEVDAAAAHVNSVLLPQLHKSAQFRELLQGARLEADQQRAAVAAQAQEKQQQRQKKKTRRVGGMR